MALALTELFRFNRDTCLGVRQEHIDAVFTVLRRYSTRVPNLLLLLEAVVKIEEFNVPVKRNQVCVERLILGPVPQPIWHCLWRAFWLSIL